MPLFTTLGALMMPLAGAFFMLIVKDPELARRVGLISAKAQLTVSSADWPSYLGFLAMGSAVLGIILPGFVASWMFGREFVDRTAKDLLGAAHDAVDDRRGQVRRSRGVVGPAGRGITLLAACGLGAALQLPPVPAQTLLHGVGTVALTAGLSLLLMPAIAFFAGAGRGYLAPIGIMLLAVFLAQIVAVLGWGEFFPWAIPALYAGMAGPEDSQLGAISYVIVVATAVIGVVGTLWWWGGRIIRGRRDRH